MSIEKMIEGLTSTEQAWLLGRDTTEPLTKAFEAKRVVHAGLEGQMVPPKMAQEVWESIMAQTTSKSELQSAYIHIPFCQTKCTYCGFFQNAANQSAEDHYIDLLIEEIENATQARRLQDGLIQAVFIGGGTPSSLSAHNVSRLLQTITTCLPLSNDYELTLEGRIHDLIPEKMDAWFNYGVNRVSLGVQSFHTHIRRQLGRLDDQDTVMRRLEAIKAYNQCAVIVDLIYGLPDQTMELWMEDLQLLTASAADGMDLYQLNVFENSDLNRLIQAGKVSPAATTAEQAYMYEQAYHFVEKYGYRRLSSCHWSRTTRERSLYNMMAKRGYAMFPFGCGAGGNIDSYTTMLQRSLGAYEAMIEQGQKPFMVLMKQDALAKLANEVIDQLEHCHFDLTPFIQYDARLEGLRALYDLWCQRGLCIFNGVMYRLTVAGEFWHVNLTQSTIEFMKYLLTGTWSLASERIAAQNHGVKVKQPHSMKHNETNQKSRVHSQLLTNELPAAGHGLRPAKEAPSLSLLEETSSGADSCQLDG